MVVEVFDVNVLPGQEPAFAEAYAKARETVVTTPGCHSARMMRCIESPARFVMIVEWDSFEAHTENFRETERFTIWRDLVGPYFDGSPKVEHFEDV